MSESDGVRYHPNSALYWLPVAEWAITTTGVRVPETEVVDYDFWDAVRWSDGDPEADAAFLDAARDAVERVGLPAFLRTDLSSGKHRGIEAIKIAALEDVPAAVGETVSFNATEGRISAALLVREWIDVDSRFRAFGGLPIGVEFRLFADADDVRCAHYYWPAPKFERRGLPDSEWREDRSELASTPVPARVERAATRVVEKVQLENEGRVDPDQAWSVDFARDEEGVWWLIDMALAEDSWHAQGCSVPFGGGDGSDV